MPPELNLVNSTVFLAITIDSKLQWGLHIRPLADKLSSAAYASRATPAQNAYRNHGGDNRGNIRERGHPQGGPQEPQDRGGEDMTVLCNRCDTNRPRTRRTTPAHAPAHITDNTFDSEHGRKH
ncbi:unnamed protein product [Euphydryas editha]|uniref:Uncharacterized protein n=1 Tax=Euphydryas editha TaxID=104508 RepID=A0AAU9V502_EUPED|nr:unnamed protein product [Euphydryas editha]